MNQFLMGIVAVVPPNFGKLFHQGGSSSVPAMVVFGILLFLLLAVLLRPQQGPPEKPQTLLRDLRENDRVFIGAGFYRVERLANPKTRDLTLCVEERQRLHILVKPSEILSGPPGSRPPASQPSPPDSESIPPRRPDGLTG